MTRVIFRTFGNIYSITKQNQLELEFKGSTVNDFLKMLIEKFGPKMEQILYPNGNLSELIVILINGKNLDGLEGLDSKITEGDVVSVLPVTAGG